MGIISEIKRPDIFEYTDYRNFLGDTYSFLKQTKRQFSYRFFSQQAGFHSPNFLKLVIEGKRNLTLDSAEKFVQALDLKKEEALVFRNLVAFNQARSQKEKEETAYALFRSSLLKRVQAKNYARYSYFSHWYMVAIRELVVLGDFREDPEWIARKLSPGITAHQVIDAIGQLLELELLYRDETGRLRQKESIVCTPHEVQSGFVEKFHREMMRLAGESIRRFQRDRRDISSLTLSLSKERMIEMKRRIQDFRDELLALSSEDQSPDGVYQLNFQLFPLTEED